MLSVLVGAALASDDPDLIARLRDRDPDAMGALYDRYAKLAYSVTLRITRDQAVAEDLVQEVFLRLWNRISEFDSARGSLGVWIVCMARSRAIDHLRSSEGRFSKGKRSVADLDDLCFSEDWTDQISVMQRMRLVQVAIENLSDNERKALELAYFEGLSQSEIAGRLAQPLGTVKTWIRTALIKIRTSLAATEAR